MEKRSRRYLFIASLLRKKYKRNFSLIHDGFFLLKLNILNSCKNLELYLNFLGDRNQNKFNIMLSKEDTRLVLNIVDDLLDCKEAEVFRQPVDYKGNIIPLLQLIL